VIPDANCVVWHLRPDEVVAPPLCDREMHPGDLCQACVNPPPGTPSPRNDEPLLRRWPQREGATAASRPLLPRWKAREPNLYKELIELAGKVNETCRSSASRRSRAP
jgi:hypothetical protein